MLLPATACCSSTASCCCTACPFGGQPSQCVPSAYTACNPSTAPGPAGRPPSPGQRGGRASPGRTAEARDDDVTISSTLGRQEACSSCCAWGLHRAARRQGDNGASIQPCCCSAGSSAASSAHRTAQGLAGSAMPLLFLSKTSTGAPANKCLKQNVSAHLQPLADALHRGALAVGPHLHAQARQHLQRIGVRRVGRGRFMVLITDPAPCSPTQLSLRLNIWTFGSHTGQTRSTDPHQLLQHGGRSKAQVARCVPLSHVEAALGRRRGRKSGCISE